MDKKIEKLIEKFPKQGDFIKRIHGYFATDISVKTWETENNEVIKTIVCFYLDGNSYEMVFEKNNTCTLYLINGDKHIKIKSLPLDIVNGQRVISF